MFINLVIFLLVLNVLIFVHEFGHFIIALRNGVRVYEFALGFGPRVFSKRRNGVVYSLRLIPFGGFVDLEEGEKPGGLLRIPVLKQLFILLGGIVGNIILALAVFTVLLIRSEFVMRDITLPIKPVFAEQRIEKHGVLLIKVDDNPILASKIDENKIYRIVSINCKSIVTFKDLEGELNRAYKSGLKRVKIKLQDVDTATELDLEVPLNSNGKLGVVVTEMAYYSWVYDKNVVYKLLSPLLYSVDITYVGINFMRTVIKNAIATNNGELVGEFVASPVALYPIVSEVLRSSDPILNLLQLIGLLSLNLAMINLVPFPPLDGWHVLTIWFRNRFSNSSKWGRVFKILTLLGAGILIIVSLVLVFKDIKSLL